MGVPELSLPFRSFLLAVVALQVFSAPQIARGEASTIGQTGLINMPSARIEEEGTLRIGFSNYNPYKALWASISFFPWLELSGRHTIIDGVQAFEDKPEFGDYRDKAFDAKLRLLRESSYFPEITIGTQDYIGTNIFGAHFITFNKRLGDIDVTLGYGDKRIDGAFGGFRYNPSWNRNLGLVLEHDATDYRNDFGAALSGADRREGGTTYALEYKFGWIGTQLSYQHGEVGANLYVSIPLMRREFIPKTHEPKPYSKITPQPTLAQWRTEPAYVAALTRELNQQGFKNVKIQSEGAIVKAQLSHTRISLMGRAIGRAARTMLLLGPAEIKSIQITYTVNELPLVTYTLEDADRFRRYFASELSWDNVKDHVSIEFTDPMYVKQFKNDDIAMPIERQERSELKTVYGDEGYVVSIKQEDQSLSRFRIIPANLRIYYNDPSGAFRYDTFALLTYRKQFEDGYFLDTSARLTLFEDVSKLSTPSNSLLPHVRTDINEYLREDPRLKVNSLLLSRYFKPAQRVYGRVSAGYYESMYAGLGGQVMYLSERSSWATDLSVDWLRQREPGSDFGFRDYSVVTILGALHYPFPTSGVTATARVGKFLAKDEGVRFELKRRFRSGTEIGAWYTYTNEKDITNPGSPERPYYDKGVFISIPLSSMLTKDTQQRATLSVSDYTRDVGQMVESPGDLYRLLERPLMLDSHEHTPLTDFAK